MKEKGRHVPPSNLTLCVPNGLRCTNAAGLVVSDFAQKLFRNFCWSLVGFVHEILFHCRPFHNCLIFETDFPVIKARVDDLFYPTEQVMNVTKTIGVGQIRQGIGPLTNPEIKQTVTKVLS